jgi:hypothetical protein
MSCGPINCLWAEKTSVGLNVSRVTAESVKSADAGDNSFDTLYCTLAVPGCDVEHVAGHRISIFY